MSSFTQVQECGTGTSNPSCIVYFLQQNAMAIAFGAVLFGLVLVYLLDKRMNPFTNPTWGTISTSFLIFVGILALVGVEIYPLVFPAKK